MNKHLIPVSIIIGCLLNFSCKNNSRTDDQKDIPHQPNILLIIADDMGWGDISSHGNEVLSTPFLDILASESFRFERFYVSPVCAPTRASLLTGRYHLRTGVHGVTGRKEVMRNSELTLAELFRDADYSTSFFGKWHNGAEFPHNPNGQGFEHFFGFSAGHWNNYFDTKLEWNGEMTQTSGYITDVLTDSAISYIKKNKNTPFLQVVSYNVPHSPFQVPDPYFVKYKEKGLDDETACIYGMIDNTDDNIGRLLKSIEQEGITHRTLVMFLSDNGPNSHRFNGNMKGIKGSVDEGGVKVPCFLKVPWMNSDEIHIPEIAAHIDILPSLAELAGIELPEGLLFDGLSLVPLFSATDNYIKDRILFTDRGLGSKTPFAIRKSEFLLTVSDRDTLLFDIVKDPSQKNNIIHEYQEECMKWITQYNQWYQEATLFGLTPPPIETGHPRFPQTELNAHEAYYSGNVRFKEGHGWANDWLVNFIQPEDTIAWNLKVNKSGNYALKLRLHSTSENVDQELIVLQNRFKSIYRIPSALIAKDLNSPDRVKRKEVYEKEWPEWDLGEIYMEKGKYPIRLIPAAKGFKQGVEIKSLIIEHIN